MTKVLLAVTKKWCCRNKYVRYISGIFWFKHATNTKFKSLIENLYQPQNRVSHIKKRNVLLHMYLHSMSHITLLMTKYDVPQTLILKVICKD